MKRSAQDSDNEEHPRKRLELGPSIDKDKLSHDSGSTSSGDKKPKATESMETSNQPLRKCKNFAERLMRVLQSGIGKDTIWWIGDGNAVAIHTRNLKKGTMLTEQFKVKDYSVFIRNCNRWGFRRTVQYPVPQGVITYQCSLFQKDDPHLVHHMRMDSDVQDVFVKHRDSEGSDVPFDPKRIAKAARAAAAAAAGSIQHDPRFLSPTGNAGFGNSAGVPPGRQQADNQESNALQGLSKEQVLQLLQGKSLAGVGLNEASTCNGLTRDPPATGSQPATQAAPSLESALLQQLIGGAIQQQQAPPPQPPTQEAHHEQLLQRILGLADEYLNNSDDHSSSNSTEPIRMALQLLKFQGEKYKEEKETEKQQTDSDVLSTIRTHLLAASRPPAPAPTPAPTSSMTDRVLQAEHLFQSVNLARSPPTPAPVRSSLQDQGQQDRVSQPSTLIELLRNSGAQQSQPQQQEPEVPSLADPNTQTTLAQFLSLLQTAQSGNTR